MDSIKAKDEQYHFSETVKNAVSSGIQKTKDFNERYHITDTITAVPSAAAHKITTGIQSLTSSEPENRS